MILHVISTDEWKQFQQKGTYEPVSIKEEGFIHCATLEQVAWVGNTFYKNQENLLLLSIDESKVDAEVVFEDLYDLGQDYPHIYGPLKMQAVVSVCSFEPNENGTFETPIF